MRVLVTGSTGFVGTALVERLARHSRFDVRAASREPRQLSLRRIEPVLGDLAEVAHCRKIVAGVDAIVHLAARAHVMRDTASDPLAEYRRVNVGATLTLAREAAAAGVRRFVLLSSVKVNGETGRFTEADAPAPQDAYGISKLEAERGLSDLAASTGLEVVVIRPPLVYGPGVRANFLALMRAVRRGVPLPLGAIHNRRSLVGLDNLVDFVLRCVDHPAAAGETFFVSDNEDLSTTELIRRLARAMERPARLVPVPASLLLAAATLAGKRDVARRLIDSLQVDVSKASTRLAWTPPVSVDEALTRAAAACR